MIATPEMVASQRQAQAHETGRRQGIAQAAATARRLADHYWRCAERSKGGDPTAHRSKATALHDLAAQLEAEAGVTARG